MPAEDEMTIVDSALRSIFYAMCSGCDFPSKFGPDAWIHTGWLCAVIVVSRDARMVGGIVIAVPCTTFRFGRRIPPSQVLCSCRMVGSTSILSCWGNRSGRFRLSGWTAFVVSSRHRPASR